MANRPKKWPAMKYGDGSWSYDEVRQQIVLRHSYKSHPYVERGESTADCLDQRDEQRRVDDAMAALAGDGTLGSLLDAWYCSESTRPTDPVKGPATRTSRKRPEVNTLRGYELSVRQLKGLFGAETLTFDLDAATFGAGLARWVDEGNRGTSALEKITSHLGQAIDFGILHKMVPAGLRDELRVAPKPAFAPRPTPLKWLMLDDYRTVREHLLRNRTGRNLAFMLMMLCGLRPGEARGLKWEYVDTAARLLRVEGQVERQNRSAWTTRLKTDHVHLCAHRTVPIAGDLALVLAAAELETTDEFVCVEDVGRTRGGLITSENMYQHTYKLSGDLRTRRITANGYRHTFASVCLLNGMQREELAVLMGHKDTTQIIKTYAHAMKNPTPPDIDRFLGGTE